MTSSRVLIAIGAVLVLGAVNASILGKESIKRDGAAIFLDLAPIDPRSLVQGDYMALAYAITRAVPEQGLPVDGRLVVAVGADNVARYQRIAPLYDILDLPF